MCYPASTTFHLHCIPFLCSCDFEAFEDDFVASSPYVPENPRDCVVSQAGRGKTYIHLCLHQRLMYR